MNSRNVAALLLTLAGVLMGATVMAVGLSLADSPKRSGVAPGIEAAGGHPSAVASDAAGSLAPGSRLIIPSIGVDASIVVVGLDGAGVMGTPDNGLDVGWYDFSGVPGRPGNTVMTGHVDYYNIGPAVFWRLRELSPGDEIEVHVPDAGAVSYRVTQVESYEAGAAPVDAITGTTDDDVLTLITCDGWFDPSIREYDHRLVVRAERTS